MKLQRELNSYLDTQVITSDNIGQIRYSCFVPWDSEWNGIVRDETAKRETLMKPSNETLTTSEPSTVEELNALSLRVAELQLTASSVVRGNENHLTAPVSESVKQTSEEKP